MDLHPQEAAQGRGRLRSARLQPTLELLPLEQISASRFPFPTGSLWRETGNAWESADGRREEVRSSLARNAPENRDQVAADVPENGITIIDGQNGRTSHSVIKNRDLSIDYLDDAHRCAHSYSSFSSDSQHAFKSFCHLGRRNSFQSGLAVMSTPSFRFGL